MEISPMTQTVIRYLLTVGLTWLATKTGNAAIGSPDFLNIAVSAVASVSVLAVSAWGLYRGTVNAKVADLAANPDIKAIHASQAIVAASDSPKVVISPTVGAAK